MSTFPIMEIFSSIQGEGAHAGEEALFIRLGGCDVGCVWCDVKESWPIDAHPKMTCQEILLELKKTKSPFHDEDYKVKNVVITGGEPCMYDLRDLSSALKFEGYEIWLESSGAYPILGEFDWICISPKKFKAALPNSLSLADELKVVVYHKSDLKWAQEFGAKVKSSCRKYLQPEWSRRKEMMHLLADQHSALEDWEISVQRHNYLGLP
jgi:organic radical activating enzyme